MFEIVGDDPLTLSRTVGFGDCDPAGIVFTPNYGRFVFDAVEVWLRRAMGIDIHQQLKGDEIGTPVRALNVELLAPLRPAEVFQSAVWATHLGRSSFRLTVRGRTAAGAPSFVGEMACVATRRSARAVVPLPDAYRAAIEAYRARCGPDDAAAG
jgi:acyl-CoA thioester hydrolase